MSLNESGEIVLGMVKLRDTFPPTAYDLFLKGLEAELARALLHKRYEIEVK